MRFPLSRIGESKRRDEPENSGHLLCPPLRVGSCRISLPVNGQCCLIEGGARVALTLNSLNTTYALWARHHACWRLCGARVTCNREKPCPWNTKPPRKARSPLAQVISFHLAQKVRRRRVRVPLCLHNSRSSKDGSARLRVSCLCNGADRAEVRRDLGAQDSLKQPSPRHHKPRLLAKSQTADWFLSGPQPNTPAYLRCRLPPFRRLSLYRHNSYSLPSR